MREEVGESALLHVQGLEVRYSNAATRIGSFDFTVRPGECLVVLGESGSGKSTLLKAILGILPKQVEQRGAVIFAGENLLEMEEKQLQKIRGEGIGILFQDAESSLCPTRRIGAQMVETLRAHRKIRKNEAGELVRRALEKFDLDAERVMPSYPFELSGGMNQRVGIALATVLEPQLLLADEPTSALDVVARKRIAEYLRQLLEGGIGIILVTHDIVLARALADKVLLLDSGHVHSFNDAEEFFVHEGDGEHE